MQQFKPGDWVRDVHERDYMDLGVGEVLYLDDGEDPQGNPVTVITVKFHRVNVDDLAALRVKRVAFEEAKAKGQDTENEEEWEDVDFDDDNPTIADRFAHEIQLVETAVVAPMKE